jgi:hypothetical protein
MIHDEITPTEQADRLAIRELVDAYAHCAIDVSPNSTASPTTCSPRTASAS